MKVSHLFFLTCLFQFLFHFIYCLPVSETKAVKKGNLIDTVKKIFSSKSKNKIPPKRLSTEEVIEAHLRAKNQYESYSYELQGERLLKSIKAEREAFARGKGHSAITPQSNPVPESVPVPEQ